MNYHPILSGKRSGDRAASLMTSDHICWLYFQCEMLLHKITFATLQQHFSKIFVMINQTGSPLQLK